MSKCAPSSDLQRLPVVERHVPRLALRRARLVLDVGEGRLVRRDQAGAGAAFDRHVADGHAAFHRQRADRLAGIFDDVAGAAGRSDLADDGEDDVLGRDAGRQLPVDAHQHVLGLALDQRLGGEHMLDFRGADAVRQRTEGAVGRGVAVAADDGHAGQREALLRADDVHDALADIVLRIILDAEIAWRSSPAPRSGCGFPRSVDAALAVGRGRHVVVDHGQRLFRVTDLAAGHAQALEGLRAGHLVHEMAVDIEQAGAVVLAVDHMVVENLVVEGARCAHMRKSVDLSRRKGLVRALPEPASSSGVGSSSRPKGTQRTVRAGASCPAARSPCSSDLRKALPSRRS